MCTCVSRCILKFFQWKNKKSHIPGSKVSLGYQGNDTRNHTTSSVEPCNLKPRSDMTPLIRSGFFMIMQV